MHRYPDEIARARQFENGRSRATGGRDPRRKGNRPIHPVNRRKFRQPESQSRLVRGERRAIHGGHKSCQLEATAGSHNSGDRARTYTCRNIRILDRAPSREKERGRGKETKGGEEGKKRKTKKGRKCRTRERTRTDKCLKGAPLPRDPKKGTPRYPGMRGVRYAVRKFLGIKSD